MTDSKQQVIEQIKLWLVKYELGKATLDEAPKAIYAIAQRHFQPDGHGEPCYYCGKPCDNLAAAPIYAIQLMHSDDPGVMKWHHASCVMDRLEGKPDAAAGGNMVERVARALWDWEHEGRKNEILDIEWGLLKDDYYQKAKAVLSALPQHKDTSARDNDIACENCDAPAKGYSLDEVPLCEECGRRLAEDEACAPVVGLSTPAPRPDSARAGRDAGVLLDPDMPAQELRLHCGEMTAGEERTGRACIRWANSVRAEHPSVTVADLQPIREALMTARDNAQFVLDKCDHKYIPTIAIKDIRSAADMALAALEARAAKDGGA